MARKGENIYKRKDGRWEGRYHKINMADGRQKYASVYGKTYKEVKEKLFLKKREQLLEKGGQGCLPAGLTIGEAAGTERYTATAGAIPSPICKRKTSAMAVPAARRSVMTSFPEKPFQASSLYSRRKSLFTRIFKSCRLLSKIKRLPKQPSCILYRYC